MKMFLFKVVVLVAIVAGLNAVESGIYATAPEVRQDIALDQMDPSDEAATIARAAERGYNIPWRAFVVIGSVVILFANDVVRCYRNLQKKEETE